MTTLAFHLGLYSPLIVSLDFGLVITRLQIWRLVTNFFFLGPFSLNFGFNLVLIAQYGVALERVFDRNTSDYLWMLIIGAMSLLVMAVVPFFGRPFMGKSMLFMMVYVWAREIPNELVEFYGLVIFKGFYVPWVMLVLDLIIGQDIVPGILGVVAGHLYYFLAVIHPLAGGKFIHKTPLWVHKFRAHWGVGSQMNDTVHPRTSFRGRGFRLGGSRTSASEKTQTSTPTNRPGGAAFQGRSNRLQGRG